MLLFVPKSCEAIILRNLNFNGCYRTTNLTESYIRGLMQFSKYCTDNNQVTRLSLPLDTLTNALTSIFMLVHEESWTIGVGETTSESS